MKNKSYHLVYFFLHPFFSLLYYLKNFRKEHSKNVIWLFTIFFGFTISIGKESQGSDIVRYMRDVTLLHDKHFTLSTAIEYFISTGEIDIGRTFLTILVSRFTDNGYYLIIVFATIFGYFFSRNMWFILDRLNGRIKPVLVILIIVLFLVVPIWDLGGFRFWTAAHVFTYGCLHYFFKYKPKRILWAILTPFVFHFAFLLPLSILLIHMISGSRLRLYYFFFLFSFLISEINVGLFNTYIESYTPEILQERTESYRSETALEKFEDSKSSSSKVWYAEYQNKFIAWPLMFTLILSFWVFKQTLRHDKNIYRIFSFTYLFFGVSNIFTNLPSGGRFQSVAILFSLSVLIIFLQNKSYNKLIINTLKLSSPLLFLFIIVSIREGFYLISLMTIMGNPIFAMFSIGENISLNDIIK